MPEAQGTVFSLVAATDEEGAGRVLRALEGAVQRRGHCGSEDLRFGQ
jgi:hypothetical protein